MKRIKKIAVLGSGVMGSALACHMANSGFKVLMLDMPAKEGADRNAVARGALKAAVKSKPAPLYSSSYIGRIELGNFEDDLPKIADCDWILEVIIEDLGIKNSLYERVEKYRKPGTLVSSNTSGIPIQQMSAPRSDDFQAHFCGTHFFNPPRYLRLLEIIPGPKTNRVTLETFDHLGSVLLGKEVVKCKDTPAFIANRIGVFAMSKIYSLAEELELNINDVDKLTGPAIGRPNTGTFRLGDLVGLDVASKVVKGIQANCPDDKAIQALTQTKAMAFLLENGHLGNKTGQGFYKKTNERDDQGRRVILGLNLKTLEYEGRQRSDMKSLKTIKIIDDPKKRIQTLYKGDDNGAELLKRGFLELFSYVSMRLPEISDDIVNVDNALKTGFGWDFGPFEYWDILGLEKTIEDMKSHGLPVGPWVEKMLSSGTKTFYSLDSGSVNAYSPLSASYESVKENPKIIILNRQKAKTPVLKNDELTLHDIGDGVLCAEFTSKMNAIGEGIIRGTTEAIQIAEEDGWKGLVIANDSKNFTVGANLMMVAMLSFQKQFDELSEAVRMFQELSMRCRYSTIPVVSAPQGYVFGGGCEISMHCDSVMASAESYVGLVEAGVGVIPGGGGTKEFALRASDNFVNDELQIPSILERFKTIATARVATSAVEAFEAGYFSHDKDHVVMNSTHRIGEGKKKVLELADDYVMPIKRDDITVLGRSGLATLLVAAHSLQKGGYATEHDIKVATKMAYVLCGGDLSSSQKVSEDYLLELEREAFVSLCGEQKTLERIQHMLENNKPLRN